MFLTLNLASLKGNEPDGLQIEENLAKSKRNFFRFVKRAAKPSLNWIWRHFMLDDPDKKMSGVFCPAPVQD